jgi:hypothetical protein
VPSCEYTCEDCETSSWQGGFHSAPYGWLKVSDTEHVFDFVCPKCAKKRGLEPCPKCKSDQIKYSERKGWFCERCDFRGIR